MEKLTLTQLREFAIEQIEREEKIEKDEIVFKVNGKNHYVTIDKTFSDRKLDMVAKELTNGIVNIFHLYEDDMEKGTTYMSFLPTALLVKHFTSIEVPTEALFTEQLKRYLEINDVLIQLKDEETGNSLASLIFNIMEADEIKKLNKLINDIKDDLVKALKGEKEDDK